MNCPMCGKELVGKQKTYCSRKCMYAKLSEKAQSGFSSGGKGKPRELSDSKLARLRAERGMTQARLIELSGLSHTTITDIERGRAKNVTIGTYKRLADVLGVDWRELAE